MLGKVLFYGTKKFKDGKIQSIFYLHKIPGLKFQPRVSGSILFNFQVWPNLRVDRDKSSVG